MTEQAFAAFGLLGAAAVGTSVIAVLARELLRQGWTFHRGLGVTLTATGTLAMVASISGVA